MKDSINWVIRIITTIMLSMVILVLTCSQHIVDTFSAKYLLLIILSIVMLFVIYKINNIFGLLALFITTICITIYLGHTKQTNTNNTVSESIISIDYTNNTSDILNIGFDNNYYYVFMKDNAGSIELIKLPCNKTMIKEVETEQKPTYSYKKLPQNLITDREITVTKGKYKLIKQ